MHDTWPLLKDSDFPEIRRAQVDTLQLNLGYLCILSSAAMAYSNCDLLDGNVPRRIAVAGHCYGCTAGQGSSCGGALEAVPRQKTERSTDHA